MCKCLKDTCRSIPWATIVATLIAMVAGGLAIHGWSNISSTLSSSGFEIGKVQTWISMALGATVVLDIVILLLAFCATGRTRELCVEKMGCCGRGFYRFLQVVFIALVWLSILWNLALVVAGTAVLILQFTMNEFCNVIADLTDEVTIHLGGFFPDLHGVTEISSFCHALTDVLHAIASMLAGAILSVVAQAQMLACICVNFVRIGAEARFQKRADHQEYEEAVGNTEKTQALISYP